MFDELKGKISDLFDRDEFETLPEELRKAARDEPKLSKYYDRLKVVNEGLRSAPPVAVPAGFVATVLRMLPSKKLEAPGLFRLRDLLLPAYIGIVLVLSFLFGEQLGLTALFEILNVKFTAANDTSLQLVFVAVSSSGILFTLWLIVTSFFGIRSRRVVK